MICSIGCPSLAWENRPFKPQQSPTSTSTAADAADAATVGLSYSHARHVRAHYGHEAAVPFYRDLLQTHPSDRTAATYIASSSETPIRQDTSCRCWDNRSRIQEFRSILDQHKYTNAHIQDVLNIPTKLRYAKCPIYVTPLAAGTTLQSPPLVPQTGLETLIAMFLIGLVQPKQLLDDQFGPSFVPLLQELGLAFVNDDMDMDDCVVIPYVHIFPLALLPDEEHQEQQQQQQQHVDDDSIRRNLCLVTDLHPRILSTTTVGTQNHHTVMYIGPDSLALVQHYTVRHNSNNDAAAVAASGEGGDWNDIPLLDTVLDVCTGSGIQALSIRCRKVICIDINPRALQFVKFNAALNGRTEGVYCILGNVVTGEYEHDPASVGEDQSLLLDDESVDLLLANPPFIPVPPNQIEIGNRYGLFSSGGTDGEMVLEGIMKLASHVVKKTFDGDSDDRGGGRIAIVSEFMNPDSVELRHRLQRWCPGMQGVLLTNQDAISSDIYAARRADSETEFEIWNKHLEHNGIRTVSPGLLFLRRGDGDIQHHRVPKTEQGSIWTPSNQDAVTYTQQVFVQEGF